MERVNQPLALEAVHGHLVRECAARRARAEGFPGDFPVVVIRAFKIGDEQVLGREDGHQARGSHSGHHGEWFEFHNDID